jgi:two-component system OmpR family response regulator
MTEERDYRALVLDIGIPGIDGIEVCRRLRRREKWVPILMLTGRSQVADRVSGLDAGADDYLTKPFALEELEARLRAVTRREPPRRPNKLVVGDLELDPATYQVVRAGRLLSLTPKEFSLLRLLMSQPGRVVSRSTILEQLWDFSAIVSDNAIDVLVNSVRTKVDRSFGRSSIETVRGMGYRLRREE